MLPLTTPLTTSSPASHLPGTWKLGAGRAITLQPDEDGAMRVSHGCIWATYDGPHRGALNDFGDYVVGAGDRLWVRAGQRLVIQSWERQAPAYFSWDPVVETRPARELNVSAVVQPLADLRLALAIGANAVRRLGAGLVRLAWSAAVPKSRHTCPSGA